MYDANNVVVSIVLGQRKHKVVHSIYYGGKTLDFSQANYIVSEKEIVALVFPLDKFRSYYWATKVIVYNDRATIRYLFNKKYAKPRLIQGIFLFSTITPWYQR